MNTTANPLYPIFLRMDRLHILIVGAGEVGYEKLSFLLKSSPNARITIVAPFVSPEVQSLLSRFGNDIIIHKRRFRHDDVINHQIVVAATNIHEVNKAVYCAAKRYEKIVNVADTPELCDFYMGSIVTRGDLKVAISTNGKSPTFAKRVRQVLEYVLPEETHQLVNNLKGIRDQLKGEFSFKVKELNKITKSLVEYEGISN